jgi:hypothetical protein
VGLVATAAVDCFVFGLHRSSPVRGVRLGCPGAPIVRLSDKYCKGSPGTVL